MFPLEQGALEMVVIGAIALMVLGPKDLPIVMRRVGQFIAKMRGMAAEFRASFDELARQSELEELRKEVESLRIGGFEVYNPAVPEPSAPDPAPYTPFDPAASLSDTHGFSFPPQPMVAAPPAVDDAAAAKPARKPRAAKASPTAPVTAPRRRPRAAIAAPVTADEAPPAKRRRAKPAAQPDDTAG